ncbi:hypothetical protein [Sunxiuqinia indica]|uniref:hypothetical protein n=1 Tax=Sunxiuqinia indica TaxID=2692584 RepID=UPI0013573212|nr:hypothetical protein [Sunxiuqinia indica]
MKTEQLSSSLVYATDEMPGYHRIKISQGFIYKKRRRKKTTLMVQRLCLKKHLKEGETTLEIQFKGKSGKFKTITTNHPTSKKLLKGCSELPGYELFHCKSNDGYKVLNSEDVTEYLREISSHETIAKNFRTWRGTVLSIKFEPEARKIVEEPPRKKKM